MDLSSITRIISGPTQEHQKEISPKGVYCGPKQCTEDQTSFLGKVQGVQYTFGISWDLSP
jgi:hypothetical protein